MTRTRVRMRKWRKRKKKNNDKEKKKKKINQYKTQHTKRKWLYLCMCASVCVCVGCLYDRWWKFGDDNLVMKANGSNELSGDTERDWWWKVVMTLANSGNARGNESVGGETGRDWWWRTPLVMRRGGGEVSVEVQEVAKWLKYFYSLTIYSLWYAKCQFLGKINK